MSKDTSDWDVVMVERQVAQKLAERTGWRVYGFGGDYTFVYQPHDHLIALPGPVVHDLLRAMDEPVGWCTTHSVVHLGWTCPLCGVNHTPGKGE